MSEEATVSEDATNAGFAHLIRAGIAILLVLALPLVLYARTTGDSTVVQVYLDALSAVVAFYFGASVTGG